VVIGFRPYDEKTDAYGEVTEQHTLINPEILEFRGEKKFFNEGCLSVPDIHEDVLRPESVVVRYYDEGWEQRLADGVRDEKRKYLWSNFTAAIEHLR
jgi:peptide deformylase